MSQRELQHVLEDQIADNWCWAAVALATAVFYDQNNTWTQCTLASTELNAANCCGNPSSAACDQQWRLDLALQRVNHLDRWDGRSMTMDEIKAEIDAGRPIGVRVAWDAAGEQGHFVLITGYDEDNDLVYVEDPIALNGDGLVARTALTDGLYVTSGTWTHSYWTQA